MKAALVCLMLALPCVSFGMGKISLAPAFDEVTGYPEVNASLVVWEKLGATKFFFDGFAGYQTSADRENLITKQWSSFKGAVGYQCSPKLQGEVGQEMANRGPNMVQDNITFVKLTYQLW